MWTGKELVYRDEDEAIVPVGLNYAVFTHQMQRNIILTTRINNECIKRTAI